MAMRALNWINSNAGTSVHSDVSLSTTLKLVFDADERSRNGTLGEAVVYKSAGMSAGGSCLLTEAA